MLDAPADCPPALSRALAARDATLTQTWRENARVYLRASTPGGNIFARYSSDPADEPTLAHELAVRAIVGTEGAIRSPAVLEYGRSWLVEQAIAAEPGRGPKAVDAIVDAAAAITQLRLPEGPAPRSRGLAWALRSSARLVRSSVPIRELLAARRILAHSRLPRVSAHGDFQVHNLLFAEGVLWVVDWELSGLSPSGLDLMQAWATLEHREDRERLFEAAVELLGAEQRGQLERLRYAVVVRTIAGMLAAPAAFDRDPEGAERLKKLLPDIARRVP